MDIRSKIKTSAECLADSLNIEVEQLRLDFPEIDDIIKKSSNKDIQKIAKKYSFKTDEVKDFLSIAQKVDSDKESPDLKIAIGEDVSSYIDKHVERFVKQNLPEFWDEESEMLERLNSPVPTVKKEAIAELLSKFDVTSSHSIGRLSNEGCPVIVLQRVVEECIETFIQNRIELNWDYDLPEYFYVALENKNLPRYVFIDAIKKLTNFEWTQKSYIAFGEDLAEKVKKQVIEQVAKQKDSENKEIEEKVVDSKPVPKLVKRIKDVICR